MSAPTTAKKLITADEYARLPEPTDGTKLDLIRGEVVTVCRPTWEHGEIQGNTYSAIKQFLKTNPLGRVAVESGVLAERDPDTVRGPDVSYISKERMPLGERMNRFADVTPDLCVEVLSPTNTNKAIKQKIKDYFFNGARAVWVINPDDRTVAVYSEPLTAQLFTEDATLDGGDVLPGFTCPVADLFA